MKLLNIFRKRAFIALFPFLGACSAACPQWKREELKSCAPSYAAARLFFAADSVSCSLELEVDQSASGARMYINTFTLALKGAEDHSIPVQVTIQNKTTTYQSYLMQGGQRILLNEDAHQAIKEALVNDLIVTIAVGRYKADILPNGFADNFY